MIVSLLPPAGISDFRVAVTTYTISSGFVVIVAKNSATRISLTVSGNQSAVFISPGLPAVNSGIQLTLQTPTYHCTWGNDAALVSQQWQATASAAAAVTVIEVFFEPKSRRETIVRGESDANIIAESSAGRRGKQPAGAAVPQA
jgi:hypothetical protein